MGWQLVENKYAYINIATRLSRLQARYTKYNYVTMTLYRASNIVINSSVRDFENLVEGVQYRVGIEITSPLSDSYTFSSYTYTTTAINTKYHEFNNDDLIGRIDLRYYLEKYVSTPPSTPSSISVTPSPVAEGGTISVSWGVGSGATRYYLQRSINGGSYTDIYNGTARSYSDTALASWNTVSYRVRSYNSDGFSSYRTSPSIIVTHFPEFNVKINEALKASSDGWVKVNGVLRPIKEISVKVNGSLKNL